MRIDERKVIDLEDYGVAIKTPVTVYLEHNDIQVIREELEDQLGTAVTDQELAVAICERIQTVFHDTIEDTLEPLTEPAAVSNMVRAIRRHRNRMKMAAAAITATAR